MISKVDAALIDSLIDAAKEDGRHSERYINGGDRGAAFSSQSWHQRTQKLKEALVERLDHIG